LNKGFQRARGEIICWLNADDQYLPGAFASIRKEFERPEVAVVYGDCEEDFCDRKPTQIAQSALDAARRPARLVGEADGFAAACGFLPS
jgi:glycosyltransferase involved in cell wall biosynthesis